MTLRITLQIESRAGQIFNQTCLTIDIFYSPWPCSTWPCTVRVFCGLIIKTSSKWHLIHPTRIKIAPGGQGLRNISLFDHIGYNEIYVNIVRYKCSGLNKWWIVSRFVFIATLATLYKEIFCNPGTLLWSIFPSFDNVLTPWLSATRFAVQDN